MKIDIEQQYAALFFFSSTYLDLESLNSVIKINKI